MAPPNQQNLALISLIMLLALISSLHAYPAFYMIRNLPQLNQQQTNALRASAEDTMLRTSKRAFDRLDMSPFDFDAMTKRFSDDELSALPFDGLYLSSEAYGGAPRKRAFDRLEDSGFFGQKRKRAFDRLDNSFMLAKKKRRN